MPCKSARHERGSTTRSCGRGRTNSMQTASTMLDAASIRKTSTGLHHASRNPPTKGPSVEASWYALLRQVAAFEKVFGGTRPVTSADDAGQPSARKVPVPNSKAYIYGSGA